MRPRWLLLLALMTTVPVVPLAAPAAPLPLPGPDPAEVGRWLAPFDGQVAAVSMVLLPDGRVLYWSGADGEHVQTVGAFVERPGKAMARVLDYRGGAPVITLPTPEDGGAGDIFCAGQAMLADGHVLIAGGNRYAPIPESGGLHVYGLDQALLFDHHGDLFAPTGRMAAWRWYPTVLPLSDGGALAVGGTSDLMNNGNVRAVERYDAARGTWRTLPAGAETLLPLYPHVMEVPSGPYAGDVVYVPGGCTSCTSDDTAAWSMVQTLDLEARAWTSHAGAVQLARDYSASVLLPLRPPAYRPQVLTLGGGLTDAAFSIDSVVAAPLAEVLDLGAAPPTVQAASPMASPRWYPNAVLLPTGEVLAVGGALTGHKESRFNPPVLAAEAFDPEATDPTTGLPGRWTTLASMAVPRGYHSAALLLPDGRVLAGGHVPLAVVNGALTGVTERRLEVFEPPYLFHGARPVIADAPTVVAHGHAFSVSTPDAADITRAVLVRPGATTHAVDTGQRVVELVVASRGADALTLRAPPDHLLAPAGAYMLFLLQDIGRGEVPSVARFLTLA